MSVFKEADPSSLYVLTYAILTRVGRACLWIQHALIRAPQDQRPFDGSPGLIAVFHALRRLLAPRHPPHALSSFSKDRTKEELCLLHHRLSNRVVYSSPIS
jgi:hypothetical protein